MQVFSPLFGSVIATRWPNRDKPCYTLQNLSSRYQESSKKRRKHPIGRQNALKRRRLIMCNDFRLSAEEYSPFLNTEKQFLIGACPPTNVSGHHPVAACPPANVRGHHPVVACPPANVRGHHPVVACPPASVRGHHPVVACPPTNVSGHHPVAACPPANVRGHHPVVACPSTNRRGHAAINLHPLRFFILFDSFEPFILNFEGAASNDAAPSVSADRLRKG